MIPPATQRLLDFLSDPASYPHKPDHVKLVQTHASWVFIAPPFVYKVKKPVNFGFLDFSTLELRKADCERELILNRRLAEDIYLGLETIREQSGALQFDGDGVVIEWAVKMREMDSRFFLKRLVEEDAVGPAEVERVIEKLHRFYTTQPPLPSAETAAAIERMRQSTDGNFEAAEQFVHQSLSQAALDAIRRYTDEFYRRQNALLLARIQDGWIRDCHGDLHLEHIHLTPDTVRIYDCVEFNADFRYIDVACDLAFLAMDLDFNGRHNLSSHLVERFAALFMDAGLTRLMDFYKCYRACVRGKVESLHSQAETAPAAERAVSLELARRYFRLALQYAIAGSAPRAFVVMGKVASGKSALAEALAQETGWPVLSSDRLRKTMADVPLHHRGTAAERAALYAPEMTEQVYNKLFDKVLQSLRLGRPVIIDATFSRRRHRDSLRPILQAEGFPFTWIEARASDDVTRQRLAARAETAEVVSDALLEDYDEVMRDYESPDELPTHEVIRIDTTSDASGTLHEILARLAEEQALLA